MFLDHPDRRFAHLSNTCRIYQYSKKPTQLTLLKELKHPENKLKDIDLTSDKPGHYKSSSATHGAYSQPSDPKEIKIEYPIPKDKIGFLIGVKGANIKRLR